MYKSVFSTRLLHPVYFNFAQDFLVFNGESPCKDFEKFMNLESEKQDPEQEVERLMMHSELRNLVLSEATCWVLRRELGQFCNLKNLIVPKFEFAMLQIQLLILHLAWAKKVAIAERPKINLSWEEYLNNFALNHGEFFEKLKSDPSLLNHWQTKTRILCWRRDTAVKMNDGGSFTQLELSDEWSEFKVSKWQTDETMSRMFKEIRAPDFWGRF